MSKIKLAFEAEVRAELAQKKSQARLKKKKPQMRVSGKKVFELEKIITRGKKS